MAKRHRWGIENRYISECIDCGCLRDRYQLKAKYELGGNTFRTAPECKPPLSNNYFIGGKSYDKYIKEAKKNELLD